MSAKSLSYLAGLALTLIVFGGFDAQAQELRYWLTRVEPPSPLEGLTAQPGRIAYDFDEGHYEFVWQEPPASFGADGFSLKLDVHGTIIPNATATRNFQTAIYVYGILVTVPELGETTLPEMGAGMDDNSTATVQVRPAGPATAGEEVEVHIGSSTNYGYSYFYVAATTAPDGEVSAGPGTLALSTDCPQVIEISTYPPILCHLTVSGFRRDTADPIVVLLPNEKDGFGNHDNGIQVVGRTTQAVGDLPETFVTDLVIFACPSNPNEARNCYNFAATPGATVITVKVAQGKNETVIDLPFTVNGTRDKGTGGDGNPTLIGTRNANIVAAWSPGIAIVGDQYVPELGAPSAGSPQWLVETMTIDGAEFVRLCVAGAPSTCLNMGGETFQLSSPDREDPASHWTLQIADTVGAVFIVNRAFPERAIHAREGVLSAGKIDPAWPEARWILNYRD